MSKFTNETVSQFYAEHVGKAFYSNLENFITSDVVVGMELVGNGAIGGWR
jgi:nucleoside diphosphate kinase